MSCEDFKSEQLQTMVTNTLITNQASHYQLIINDQQLLTLVISGNWLLTANFPTLEPVIAQLAEFSRLTQLNFSTENLERWDSLLITELIKLLTFAHQQGIHANKTTLPIEIQRLLALVNATPQRPDAQRLIKAKTWHAHLWYSYLAAINHFTQIVMFIGEVAQSVIATLTGQSHFRRIALYSRMWSIRFRHSVFNKSFGRLDFGLCRCFRIIIIWCPNLYCQFG